MFVDVPSIVALLPASPVIPLYFKYKQITVFQFLGPVCLLCLALLIFSLKFVKLKNIKFFTIL